jgi:hypothetical protein
MIIFETNEYTIKEIPLNYRIDIKKTLRLKDHHSAIERDWYSPLDWSQGFENPLERAKWIAEEACKDHFRPITEKELEDNKTRGKRLLKRI